jgi:hypothetical protein
MVSAICEFVYRMIADLYSIMIQIMYVYMILLLYPIRYFAIILFSIKSKRRIQIWNVTFFLDIVISVSSGAYLYTVRQIQQDADKATS